MSAASTVVFQGTTYNIEVDGGSYGRSGFIVLPGSAATNAFIEYDSEITVESGGLSTHDTFSNASAIDNIDRRGISDQDTLTSVLASANISGTAFDMSV